MSKGRGEDLSARSRPAGTPKSAPTGLSTPVELADLLARVEAATGADRGLDLDLARALAPSVIVSRYDRFTKTNIPWVNWEYTASIDAAIALVERVLPGSRVMVERTREGAGWAMVQPTHSGTRQMAEAATAPLAILAALLVALQSRSHSLSDGAQERQDASEAKPKPCGISQNSPSPSTERTG